MSMLGVVGGGGGGGGGVAATVVDFMAMSAFSRTGTGTFTVDGISAEVVEFTSTSVEVTAAGLGQTGSGLTRIEFDMADLDAGFDATKPWEVVAILSADSGGYGVSIGADTNNRIGVQRQKGSSNMQALIVVAGSTTGTVTAVTAATHRAIAAFCPGKRQVMVAFEDTTKPTSTDTRWADLNNYGTANANNGASLGGSKLHFDFYDSTTTKIEKVLIFNHRN